MEKEIERKSWEHGSPKALFTEYDNGSGPRTAMNPELREKVQAAFIALEDLLVEAFPASRTLSQVLTFLEIAAMYVLRLR